MEHFISVNQWSKQKILQLLEKIENHRNTDYRIKDEIFTANLFFEPSTRTMSSFMIAQRKLGLEIINFNSDFSSVQKGESLYDTVKTFEALGAQLLVIRHEANHWFQELNNKLSIPVINAGAGTYEHPTQCLIDIDTIYQEFGYFEGLKVVINGDIRHSRVAHSDAKVLSKLGAEVYFCAAPGFEDPDLDFPYISIDEAVSICDVLILLRIQYERHNDYVIPLLDYHEKYGLTVERERKMKQNSIVLHPGPVNRNVEIASSLVESKRSRILKQIENGVNVRKAVIDDVLTEWGIINENSFEKC